MELLELKSDAGDILVAGLFWCKMDNHSRDLVHIGTSGLAFKTRSKIIFLSSKIIGKILGCTP
jgi:hypothetical protein